MKIEFRRVIGPLIAVTILILTVQQTVAALQLSGAWRQGSGDARKHTEDPYSRLEDVLAKSPVATPDDEIRNPFGFGSVRGPERSPARNPAISSTPAPPPPPARPVLTSIVWSGSDPRATVRYDGRDFSVRENTLFAEFTVRSITQTQVVLERSTGESITLTLRARGE